MNKVRELFHAVSDHVAPLSVLFRWLSKVHIRLRYPEKSFSVPSTDRPGSEYLNVSVDQNWP